MTKHAPHTAPRGGRRTKRNNAGADLADDHEVRLARVGDTSQIHIGYASSEVSLAHLSRRALALMGKAPKGTA